MGVMMIRHPAKIRDIASRPLVLVKGPPYARRHNGCTLLSASGVPGAALIVGRLRGNQAFLARRSFPVNIQTIVHCANREGSVHPGVP